ncbi:hypothetical protein GCM10014715_65930 [Streptomyces spiralis]|uniref:Uncharacterized protein n=1 Tax=Streptomyces spiralis TaxID=66376 RepID=A0A919AE77_9ACTN|nr:hypothetical protein GCM10014715_65930 [Streptomyces spiralis]
MLWLGRGNGCTKFAVNADGTLSNPQDITIAASGGHQALSVAAGFSADGSTMYAAVNGQNRVVALDAATRVRLGPVGCRAMLKTCRSAWGGVPRGIRMTYLPG